MRHRKKTKKLGRTKAHRKALLSNLVNGIIQHQQIKTTLVKAKAARSAIEKLITVGKKNTIAARRQAFKLLQNHQLVKKLFDEIAPTFADRNGGYSRIIKLGRRKGDGAELAILQLVGFEPMVVEEKKPAEKKKKKAAPSKKDSENKAKKEVQKTESKERDQESKAKVNKKEEIKANTERKTRSEGEIGEEINLEKSEAESKTTLDSQKKGKSKTIKEDQGVQNKEKGKNNTKNTTSE